MFVSIFLNKENRKVIHCEDDGEYRVYCDIRDKLCIERFYKNHLKAQSPTTSNIRKRKQINI